MTLMKSAVAAALCLAATAFAARAQAPYSTYPAYAYGTMSNTPPSWSYDPYASGLGPCPQRRPGDPPCYTTLKPTYGQPNYWPTH